MKCDAPSTVQVGTSDWSKAGEDGIEEENPHFPYRLRFHPTGEIAFPDEYPGAASGVGVARGRRHEVRPKFLTSCWRSLTKMLKSKKYILCLAVQ